MIGETVGGHKIVAPLADTSTGSLVVGESVGGKRVAIRLVRADVGDRTRIEAYLREVRAAGRVKHSSTAWVHDVGWLPDGRAFVIGELLAGETLATALRAGRMSATQIAEIARQAALVLAASHEDGAVHRALDPGRIFLVRDANVSQGTLVKVTGFGMAALLGDRARTQAYRAPEQWRDPATTDPQVDVYALGCIGFEMACGRPPFAGASADELRAKHESHVPPNARALMPDVPPDLEKLLTRMLAKEPAKRPRSMREAARGFDVLGGGAAPLAPTHQGTPAIAAGIIENTAKLAPPAAADRTPPKPKPKSRGWIPIAIVAAILVIGGGIALIAAVRSSDDAALPRDTVKR